MKTICIFLLSVIFVPFLFGQIPRTISYQGVLTDNSGNPQPDGDYSFIFNFYEASTGGNPIWGETKTLNVSKGLFSTSLGDQTPFSSDVKFDKPYFLGIKVGSDPELSPRVALTSSGYSLTSDIALDVTDGKVVKSLNGLKDDVTIEGSGGTTINANGNTITISSSGGSGIQGVQNTNNTIDITDPNGPTATVNLKVPLVISGSGNYNTFSSSNSTTGTGVYGESNSGYGIIGHSNTNIGVEGRANASGFGVTGHHDQGGTMFGALGISNNAVYGYAPGGGVINAGFFDGDVVVNEDLYVLGDKNFKIDHPLDPANKYLVHSCVESSERMNIYNGNITTDGNGFATVELPGYFEALNVDYRYQLTTIGQQAQTWVESKIQNNHFTIRSDKPIVEISWQVTGVRNDEHAKQNPFVVEKEKEEFAKGKYLRPELFGQPKEMGINYVKNPYEAQK